MLKHSSGVSELQNYATDLLQRSSRISGNYISKPLLDCNALGQAEGLPLITWIYFNPFGPTACALFFTPVPDNEMGLLGFQLIESIRNILTQSAFSWLNQRGGMPAVRPPYFHWEQLFAILTAYARAAMR